MTGIERGAGGGDRWERSRAAEDLVIRVQNRNAVQVVAAQARDLDDCVELLAMLGLNAHD